jgi:hypothetical protein
VESQPEKKEESTEAAVDKQAAIKAALAKRGLI